MNPCRRILVVDDHPDTAQSMAAVLRHMGHLVEYSLSGHAALEIARKFRPEIAFLDMLLPDFDGSNLSRLEA